ncbi:hypothetical protein BDW22DRAFT_583802 [Trametopsis cervina]|nr:hypothetical protein BDW22DRAFT_583802 [Trametopsis cervina]
MTGPEDKTEYVVTLGDHIFSQYSLVGRRTTVYEGTSPAEEGIFVVKISQQYVGRTSEVDLVKRAKKYGVTNLVNIRKSKDLWKLSDGIRKAFDLPTGDDDRVMRCIVMDNYARLSEQLARDPDSIQIMVPQMIDCVDFLRYKAKILHRDISDSNIMYEPRSGQDWFVLIDFDLAVRVDKKGKPLGPTSRHRTGTLPFMAVDVIEDMHLVATEADYKPIVHCVRHDFESLLWVCLYFGIKTLSPNTPNRKVEEEKRRKYLAKWETGDCDDIHATKLKVFRQAKSTNKIPLSNHFEHLRPWFGAFLSCFRSGYQEFDEQSELGGDHEQSEQRPPRFELIETWFGHVTREKMLEAFDNLKLQEAASASTSVSASASESKPKPESEPESESDASSIASDD